MFGLDALLSPRSADEFRHTYYRERALYIPGAKEKFEGLFGWDDINDVLNTHRLSWDGARLVYETKNLPHEALRSLDQWLARGATLVINSYTSCPSKQGFDTHYDKHDVFIVQIAGTKSWAVREPTRKWPLERETGPKGDPPDSPPYLECEMTEGDVLYIPRGHWHYAVAVTPSIHFTVGPQARTGIDLLLWLSQKLMDNDEFFRKDFPIVRAAEFGDGETSSDLSDHLDEFRKRMAALLEGDSLGEAFVRYCMTSNPVRRTYQFPHPWTLKQEITPESLFTRPPDQKALIRYDPDKKSAVVLTRGHELNLNDLSQELLAAIFSADGPVSGNTLLAACPNTNWEQLKGPLIALFDNGVLILDEADE